MGNGPHFNSPRRQIGGQSHIGIVTLVCQFLFQLVVKRRIAKVQLIELHIPLCNTQVFRGTFYGVMSLIYGVLPVRIYAGVLKRLVLHQLAP